MQSENFLWQAVETVDVKNVSSSFNLNLLCVDFYVVIVNENDIQNLRFNSFCVHI